MFEAFREDRAISGAEGYVLRRIQKCERAVIFRTDHVGDSFQSNRLWVLCVVMLLAW